MKRIVPLCVLCFLCALITVPALADQEGAPVDNATEPVAAELPTAEPEGLEAAEPGWICKELPEFEEGADVMLMNPENGPSDPIEAQAQCPRCNCTRPGTCPGPPVICIACASPIGGPAVSCQNVCCLTLVTTPWINGVCG